MNLPNYFLADLPPEATLSPAMLAEACRTLKRNRELYLAGRSTQNLLVALTTAARNWLEPDYPFRKMALELGPEATGFSRATLADGLEHFFKQLTPENIQNLLEQDLGHAERLDQMGVGGSMPTGNRLSLAKGPEFLVHFAAGNVPNPTLMSMALGLLVRSAQFVKCASGASFLPRLFGHSIYEVDSKLAACLEVAEWRGGNAALEQVLFDESDCVTATGTDESLASIRQKLRPGTRFLGYGHRLSFAFVSSEVLGVGKRREVLQRAARDVTAWNQLGCLSPHVIYVQDGGPITPEQFAQLLAEELAALELCEPRGELPVEHAAVIASRRSLYEIRATAGPETQIWQSKGSTAWTVVYEANSRFQVSCLNRFIHVKPVKDLTEALQSADSVRDKVATVGIAVAEPQEKEIALQLARWGAPRICPLGQMQQPPLTWRHDGRPALGDLITWTDWER